MTAVKAWLSRDDILQLHDSLIQDYGGASGVLNDGAIDASLSRPRNKLTYGSPSLFDLAAAYTFAFTKNHAFCDGNKRVGLTAAGVFLEEHGWILQEDWPASAETVEKLAAGTLSEEAFAEWLRANSEKLETETARKVAE